MEKLRAQQLIVMVALFVSLVGTLLLLGKINAHEAKVTGATAVIDVTAAPGIEQPAEELEEERGDESTVVRIAGINMTDSR